MPWGLGGVSGLGTYLARLCGGAAVSVECFQPQRLRHVYQAGKSCYPFRYLDLNCGAILLSRETQVWEASEAGLS
jgi:hypothetical protein